MSGCAALRMPHTPCGERVCAGLRPQARSGVQPPKAALSAEITQEGIHRRLKPISGYFIFADWEPSSKQACLIRHRRRFACFPAPLKSIFSVLCKSSENGLSGEKIFRHAECRCSHEQRHFSWEKELRGSAPAADPTMKGPASAAPRWRRWGGREGAAVPRPPDP